MRKLLAAAAVGLLVWAVVVVPLPIVRLAPAPADAVGDVIELAQTTDEVTGQLLYTAVAIGPVTTAGGVEAWLDPYEELQLPQQVVPPDVDPERFVEIQQRVFGESLRVAAAVGERLAGRDVSVSGDGARVAGIVPGSPAEDGLQVGDVIVEAGGEPIELSSQLVSLATGLDAGDEIRLTVRRDGERVEVTVTLDVLAATDQPGLGVLVQTVDQQIDLPVDVEVAPQVVVGGPSAGLMMALTVYDLLDEDDLTGGRVIAGTGTVDVGGNVGPISGIVQKVRGAHLADAEVFLAPDAQVDEARSVAPEGLTVIGVATVQEAVEALQDQPS